MRLCIEARGIGWVVSRQCWGSPSSQTRLRTTLSERQPSGDVLKGAMAASMGYCGMRGEGDGRRGFDPGGATCRFVPSFRQGRAFR